MDSDITIADLNLDKVCRVCLMEYEDMYSIFCEVQAEGIVEERPVYLYEILMNISSIRISAEDSLPSMMCTSCTELAHTSYKFQQQCNRSQTILDTYVSKLQTNDYTQDVSNESKDVLHFLPIEDDELMPGIIEQVDEISTTKLDTSNFSEDVEVKSDKDISEAVASEEDCEEKKNVRKRTKLEGSSIGNSLRFFAKVNENGIKCYRCDFCGKTYKHSNSLRIHIRTHTLERPYLCSHCGKGFKQFGALTYHLRSHTGEQPYACKICGKRYKQSGTLTAHMRVHTGQKPFLCSVCGRGFRQAPDLGYHMRTHTKERPYMCSVCGKTMRMQCHLVQHMRIHTGERPFKCTECNKAFPSSTRLKRHAIIHTGLKPYTCDVCGKSFNRLSSLKVHAKIHTDERPHVCSICGKGFIQAHALRTHLQTHSSGIVEVKTE